MFDDLASYFYHNVVSSFEEYLSVKGVSSSGVSRDIKTAMVAASALFHLREHLPSANVLTRSEVENLCADYGVLGDIVNASKHSLIKNKTPHGEPVITNAKQLVEEVVFTEYEDEAGKYQHVEKLVVIKLTNGTKRNVLEIMINVMNFWQTHLHSLKIISNPHIYQFELHQEPKSRAECESSNLGLEITAGLRFHQSWQLQRYNYETNAVEPIDLTGAKAEFNIYRPCHYMDVSLTHDATGREFKKTIILSEEESSVLSTLRTDAEKQAYVEKLPSIHEALQQLAIEAKLTAEGEENR